MILVIKLQVLRQTTLFSYQILTHMVSAYTNQNGKLKAFFSDANIIKEMSLLVFCLNFKVLYKGLVKNKTEKDNTNIVIDFYSYLSSYPLDDKVYTQYCKYAFIKYRPWK